MTTNNATTRLASILHEACEKRWAELDVRIPGYQATLHGIDAHHEEAKRLLGRGIRLVGATRLHQPEGDGCTCGCPLSVNAGRRHVETDSHRAPHPGSNLGHGALGASER